jgi:hypothetical protein
MGAAVDEINPLRVYTTRPGTIDPPAVIFTMDTLTFDTSLDGDTDDISFMVTTFTSMSSDRGEAELYGYIQREGSLSIKQHLESDDTLGGLVEYLTVTRATKVGIATYGGAQFYAAPLEVHLGVSGI